jgi:nucleotide-binding universal stress UspA family protein
VFKSILVGTDGSARAERAVEEAVALAKAQDGHICLVAAYSEKEQYREPVQSSAKATTGHVQEAAEQVLKRAARRAEEAGVPVDYEARVGDPVDVLLDVASERDVDLIVIGNKGMTGARRYWLGNVPNKISHHATTSVMIVRTD